MGPWEIDPSLFARPFTFEASAKRAYQNEDWAASLDSTMAWMIDEPFSGQPPAFGSFVAIEMLDDPVLAARFSEFGLETDPYNSLLLNNLAVALAKQNRGDDALKIFQRIKQHRNEDFDWIIFNATRGLIMFRLGNVEEGRRRYSEAHELTRSEFEKEKTLSNRTLLMRVVLNWAYEEAVRDPTLAKYLVDKVQSVISEQSSPPPPEVAVLLRRIEILSQVGQLGADVQVADQIDHKAPTDIAVGHPGTRMLK